jgi:hypothetical protein
MIAEIINYARTNFYKTASGQHVSSIDNTSTNQFLQVMSGLWRSTAAISSITILPSTGTLTAGTVVTLYGRTASPQANITTLQPIVFNFTTAGDASFYADQAMTLTQQATVGTGTVSYEKSTAAAPGTFSSTTSPISLEAGAWLRVTAASVGTRFAVALKRTS